MHPWQLTESLVSCQAGGMLFWTWRKRRSRRSKHKEMVAKPFSDTSSMSTDTYRSKGSVAVRLCTFNHGPV